MTAVAAPASLETQAPGSSFYAAMRLLPARERAAMFAVYDFCRKVDDIADDPGPSPAERTAALDAWRDDLAALFAGEARINTRGLVAPVRDFDLLQDDFLAVIDGMQMDIGVDIRAPSFAVLDLYCDRVASAVGRLSVRVFGMDERPGRTLAHHLGRALQFTNILRDLDEDAAIGRLYLPSDALEAAGIVGDDPQAIVNHPAISTACRWLAAKAHDHYRAADAIMAAKPTGRLRAPRLMSAVYGTILTRMEAQGWTAPRRRVSLGKARLAWIVLTRGLH